MSLFKLCAIGDAGGVNNQNAAVFAAIAAENPDHWIYLGDAAYSGPGWLTAATISATLNQMTAQGLVLNRSHWIRGNHDQGTGTNEGSTAAWNAAVPPVTLTTLDSDGDEFWELGNFRFIGIECNASILNPGFKTITGARLTKITGWLTGTTKHIIVYSHMGLSAIGHHHDQNVGAIQTLCEQHDVLLWMCGHDHNAQVFYPMGGTSSYPGLFEIVAGMGGSGHYTQTAASPSGNTGKADLRFFNVTDNGYLVIEILSVDEVKFTLKTVGGAAMPCGAKWWDGSTFTPVNSQPNIVDIIASGQPPPPPPPPDTPVIPAAAPTTIPEVAGTLTGAEANAQDFEDEFAVRDELETATAVLRAGAFTKVGVSGHVSQYVLTSPVTRNRLYAYDKLTRSIAAWDPNADDIVYKLEAGPAGKVYAAGSFANIRGSARSKVALISADETQTAPTLDATFNPPAINGRVTGLAYDPTQTALFISGAFTQVGTSTRNGLAALNATTGALLAWNPGVAGGNADCRRVCLGKNTIDQQDVYCVGEWDHIGGVARLGLAAVSKTVTVASPTIRGWVPDLVGTTASTKPHDVAITPDGSILIIATAGDASGDGNQGIAYQLVDANGNLARQNARLWNCKAQGDGGDHNACGCDNTTAYFGHHGDGVFATGGGGASTNDGTGNRKIYAVSVHTGLSAGWKLNPQPNSVQGTYSVTVMSDRLSVGSVWTQPQQGGAEYALTSAPPPPPVDQTWSDIPGATSQNFAPTLDQLDKQLRVHVVATNSVEAVDAYSDPTAPVAAAGGGSGIPVNTTAPSVSPTTLGAVGDTITGDPGVWVDADTLAFTWFRLASPYTGPAVQVKGPVDPNTDSTYTRGPGDAAAQIKLRVTATNAIGSASIETPYTDRAAVPVFLVHGYVSPDAPEIGDIVTVDPGLIANADLPSTFQWQEVLAGAVVNIPGATTKTYSVETSRLGEALRAVITAHNSAGLSATDSPQTGSGVATPSGAPLVITPPRIDRAPAIYRGTVLTVIPGTYSGGTPTRTYQWQRQPADGSSVVWTNIASATATTFTVRTIDDNYSFRCVETVTTSGHSKAVASNSTVASYGIEPAWNPVEGPPAPGGTITTLSPTLSWDFSTGPLPAELWAKERDALDWIRVAKVGAAQFRGVIPADPSLASPHHFQFVPVPLNPDVTPPPPPPAPSVTSFTPTHALEGASVVITGAAFTGATAVAFHGTAAVFTVDSDTQITATVPTGAISGTLSVTSPAGTGTSAASFTVDAATSGATTVDVSGTITGTIPAFRINGTRTHIGQPTEGLLVVTRLVNATFDDQNATTRAQFAYPNGDPFDRDRQTSEYIAQISPVFAGWGMDAVVHCLQGGRPVITSADPQPWDNTPWDTSGGIPTTGRRSEYWTRLLDVLAANDAAGLVTILQLFYFGQVDRLTNDAARNAAMDNTVDWLLSQPYRGIIFNLANEVYHGGAAGNTAWAGTMFATDVGCNNACDRVRSRLAAGGWANPLVGLTFGSGLNDVPSNSQCAHMDICMLQNNSWSTTNTRVSQRAATIRGRSNYVASPFPIAVVEDQSIERLGSTGAGAHDEAVAAFVSTGFYAKGSADANYDDGWQTVPTAWGPDHGNHDGGLTGTPEPSKDRWHTWITANT